MNDNTQIPGANIVLEVYRLKHDFPMVLNTDRFYINYTELEWDDEAGDFIPAPPHYTIGVDCSDTFFWAVGEDEPVTEETLPLLQGVLEELQPDWTEALERVNAAYKEMSDERSVAYELWREQHPESDKYGNPIGWGASPEFKAIDEKYRVRVTEARRIENVWSDLYAARVRKMRPQGAAYKVRYPEKYWPLFNEAGPEREVRMGNPREPGQ